MMKHVIILIVLLLVSFAAY
ncbi:type I toxin-antitoxin system Ibs family toxin [Escherichia coli]|nr:type I toxin-antitoxin system Ibs family toxin [Escherichia coli]EKK2708375.1 type I toxin-antitoxin system Ibs family toxin [Escherichia coli O121]EEQ9430608.1 type I toxin-antitoxin system Ibs family toxin [Escherichia coli]EEU2851911.1 type I toxin-antitoxin system Ibs family toxin [Escherichia coli]EEV3321347.1 type I toxin-antitoxin system Ibs family toxin [Escherichia coli]EEV6872752.1 type I toxin-antitoxin system Ibs family toxin [Escherichia coli]